MNHLNNKILELLNHGKHAVEQTKEVYQPLFFRLHNPSDKELFLEFLQEHPHLKIYDHIESQLVDLIKVLHPSKKFTDQELTNSINEHVQGTSIQDYGVWVYYPWSDRLVHMLDAQEFIEVRTSRNKNKITNEERDVLTSKIIGVIGLSVGQSVSVTLAQERICGELRLADFDSLELTNLNRIRTGVQNLGIRKVYSVAREIAEIDPFIKVRCFVEGVTEDNIETFFLEHGKMSLLVEESDGFDIKILARYKARELGIPVIMEASDRCMVDVERFDLEPNREILHGIVKHLDIPTLKSLRTTEEKIPYMLDVLGLDTSSTRLKASMLEIDQSINTWPQLASAVTMGGGITADVSRRLLLGHFNDSGRYYVDIEEIIGEGKSQPVAEKNRSHEFPALNIAACKELVSKLSNKEHVAGVSDSLIKEILHDAILAPTAGNNQPWKWFVKGSQVYLFHDKSRSFGWTDPSDSLAHMGLGAAIENFVLSAANKGLQSTINYQTLPNESQLVAEISLQKAEIKLNDTDKVLQQAIAVRCSNRKKGSGEKIEDSKLQLMRESLSSSFALEIIEDKESIMRLADVVASVEKLRFMHPEGHAEFFQKELRWTTEQVQLSKDGLDIETLELTNLNKTGLKMSSDAAVMQKLVEWNGGGGLKKISKETIETSSAICLVKSVKSEPLNFLQKGMGMQRVWLAANACGLSFHPISSPIFFFDRLKKGSDLPPQMAKEIAEQQIIFDKIFAPTEKFENVFLFRIAISGEPTAIALRRDLEDCLEFC